MRLAPLALLVLLLSVPWGPPLRGQTGGDTGPTAGVRPDGGGAFIRGGGLELRVLGYVQSTLTAYPRSFRRDDAPAAFEIRRARLDFLATLGPDHTLFIELDGAPGARTALVEAWMDWKLAGPALTVRAGKFISRFSAENLRSSRSLLTAERYMALNSMFFLPALDTQTGVALLGSGLAGGRLGWEVGVYNGNGQASANRAEDNDAKELQGRLVLTPGTGLDASVAVDWTREGSRRLRLLDLAFNEYVGVEVEGERLGWTADVSWSRGPWSVASEVLSFTFDTPEGGEVGLRGGYVQPAWFARGDAGGGLQLLLRGERAALVDRPAGAADALTSLTVGLNWYPSGNSRLQVNAVATRANGPAPSQGFTRARWLPLLLTQLQLKL